MIIAPFSSRLPSKKNHEKLILIVVLKIDITTRKHNSLRRKNLTQNKQNGRITINYALVNILTKKALKQSEYVSANKRDANSVGQADIR